ncbi:hypothetical protein BDV96DRAFT_593328 [Lophiotrema nucula]|uniref:DUF7580 domain-containing protein n=1 Tax=Lophiotrema nucula TaxID=690887 RepID=A0A6A5ZVD4_9PLEO|nr:hypothetical protein BDV96DRAFT_593328 [Lophiotrema nucula]
MSGIEIAGLALGAIPVLLETIKSYQDVYDKIQTFKKATKQFQIIDAQLQVCRLNFRNECCLILDLVLHDREVSNAMVKDASHVSWHSTTTQQRLDDLLRDHADACATIVSDTYASIQRLRARLLKFQISSSAPSRTLQRARNSATFTMEKSRFERDLSELRKRNADLSLLRTQLTAMQSRPKASFRSIDAPILGQVQNIRNASSMLYETLKTSWSCSNQRNVQHSVKLCVDARPSSIANSVNLDIAITCDSDESSLETQSPLAWVMVQSDNLDLPSTPIPPQKLDSLVQAFEKSFKDQLGRQDSSSHMAVAQNFATRQRSVQRDSGNKSSPPDDSSHQSSTVQLCLPRAVSSDSLPVPKSHTETTSASHTSNGTDICKVANACSFLQKALHDCRSSAKPYCLGYLKSRTDSTYLFYPPVTPGIVNTALAGPAVDHITTLISLIECSDRGSSDLIHQCQLALKISKSVLQFHGTPWLRSTWKLHDLSIFGSELSDESLLTLHLSTYFESSATGVALLGQGSPAMDKLFSQSNAASAANSCLARLCPGIYNEALFSLGVALLEIAHWQPLRSMAENDANDFFTAHRLVRGRPPLGPKYRKVVERCLRCDFGVSSESLEDLELQQAVWAKVVLPLEALIRDISQEE